MPRTLAILPARFGSTRLPGKPLLSILGKSLIQRTYEQVKRCPKIERIVVATDDQRIADHVSAFGGQSILTPTECPTGTDRLVAALKADPSLADYDYVINVQGDEPLIEPSTIEAVAALLHQDTDLVAASAIALIENPNDLFDPSIVKCTIDTRGNALYFSRNPIPWHEKKSAHPFYRHVGIYGFQRAFLLKYAELPQTPLQIQEDLEQLKILEHGYPLRLALVCDSGLGVNTPQDLKKVIDQLCTQNTSSSPAE